jgi:histidinol-phosphate aminotransferase
VPEIKPHLKNLYRSKMSDFSRMQYLRLDMNESIQGLPENFTKEILSSIDSSFLATYPEYYNLLKKVADHNGLEPENICLSNGSDSAIKYIFDAYV